jgi:uncharacterized damage-inducible protein DinB
MINALDQIRRLFAHNRWADAELMAAVRDHHGTEAWREYSHILGAEEVWLSRLEGRRSSSIVWPKVSVAEAESLRQSLIVGYDAYLSTLTSERLEEIVSYTTSAGQPFSTAVGDIMLHVALHGQYHRGKVNLLLRQTDSAPAPTDFIGFVRGVPAAGTPR